MNSKTIITILLNVAVISTFIGIFFFTYAAKVEGEIVDEQVDFLVKDFTSSFVPFMPKTAITVLRDKIKNGKLPDMSGVDKEVEESNKKLKKKAFMILGIFFTVCVAISLLIWYFNRYTISTGDMKLIVKETFIILLFVAVTEFIFIKYIAKNYLSAEPNLIKLNIIKLIEENTV